MKYSPFFIPIITSLLVTSCASGPIDRDSRNKDKSYDGTWVGTIDKTPAEFRTANWRITCWDMAGKLNMRINDGEAVVSWRNFNKKGYVGDNGKLTVIMPGTRNVNNSTKNKGTLHGGINFVVKASLEDGAGSGRLTQGWEAFANQGCSSKISFKKTG